MTDITTFVNFYHLTYFCPSSDRTLKFYTELIILVCCDTTSCALFGAVQMMFSAASIVVSDSPSQSVEQMSLSSQADETAVNDTADASNASCAVCLDKGSGFHYGVYSCEGCKVGITDSS